ncbi:MAG: 16S rRNA (guanine(527)-N(7))-methyltransferase RsmG [Gammaproteobacteria bacterium]|nr:16S rRNA (guanine(527)-N(7))-methyltransferase RsmG [Gammaproteobacteria bacterium]NNJ49334.1 16S rRNA (guanine(527)-N(7))-methyltransferase RsmG [Gammaproteobacteria bacterium]
MGLHYSVPVQQKLVHYIQLIARWNKTFNLTAIRDVEEMVSKHLLDSLVVQPYVEGKTVLDVGSGAGLPGIPFAITSPEKRFVLIDSNGKKTRFLMQAKIDLKLDNVEVIHQRVEDYQPVADGHRIYFDVITARAYATTDEILSSTAHLQGDDTSILVMQGKLDERIESDRYQIVGSYVLEVYGLGAERHLLEIKKI